MARKTNKETCFARGCTVGLMWIAASLVSARWSYGQAESLGSSGSKSAGQTPYLTCTPPLSENDRKVFVALHKKYSVEFDGTTVPDVASVLAKLTGQRVIVDTATLKRDRIDPNTSVIATREDATLESILWDILLPRRLDYRVKDGALHITSRTASCSHPVTWTYSVKDLCRTEGEFTKLVDAISSLTPEPHWESFGGFAKLSPDSKNRKFTLIHAQSDQDKALRYIIDKRRAAKVPTGK